MKAFAFIVITICVLAVAGNCAIKSEKRTETQKEIDSLTKVKLKLEIEINKRELNRLHQQNINN